MAIGKIYTVQICVVGVLAWYTCSLVVNICKQENEEDLISLTAKMWGKRGESFTLVMSCLILLGAMMAVNVLMNSSFFNVLKGISI